MPIEIELPDGTIAEFPDGMDNAEIERVLSQQFGGQQAKPDFGNVQASSSTAPVPDDPTAGMGRMEKLMAGVGRSYHELYRGAKQRLTESGYSTAHAVAGSDRRREQLERDGGESLVRQQEEIDRARVADAPLMNDGWGQAGNILGMASQFIGPGMAARTTGAAGVFLPATIKGNIAQGAFMGNLQPTATGESKVQNALIGGAAGGTGAWALNSLARGIRGGANAVAGRFLTPDDQAAARILSREADNPGNILAGQQSRVPGVQRTLAEETLDPGIARLERTLRSNSPGFDAIDRSNNAARVSALQQFAGDDAALSAARADRTAQTEALRQTAMADRGVDVASITTTLEDQIKRTATRPSVQSALLDVQRSLANAGDDVFSLYGTRKYIDDLLSGKAGADKAYARAATRELMEIKGQLDKQLASASPSFDSYLQRYREMSVPINRMQVGQALVSRKSGGAVLDPITGAQVLTPAQFSKASRSLDEVAAKATGFAKAKATDILQPGDIAIIKAIQDDLERQAFRATAGSGGNSQTFERLATDSRIGQRATGAVAGFVPGGKYVQDFLEMLDKSKNDRVKERLAYLVANPSEARRVISALPTKQQEIVEQAIARVGGAAGRAAGAAGFAGSQPMEIDIIGGRSVPAEEYEAGVREGRY